MKTTKELLQFLAMLVFIPALSFASINVTTADLAIDKPAYNDRYSFGVDISITSDSPITSVYAEHMTTSMHSVGTWYLNESSPGRWFEWSPNHVTYSNGPLSGDIKLTITTENGEQLVADYLNIPTGIELDFVSGLQLVSEQGYRLLMNTVGGADSYYWRISDVETRHAVVTGHADHPADFPIIPYDVLEVGRTYSISGHAWKRFSCGSYDPEASSKFRSHDHIEFVAVPEPCTLALLSIGGLMLRKRKA